jgi:MFS family permease
VAPIAFGTILQPLNSSMIAVAMVAIRGHFHAGSSATWLVSGLYLAAAVAAPAMGRLADLFGPRRVSLGGLALLTVASAVAPMAPSIGVLIACRVLIGIGTSAQFPCGVAMIRHAADTARAASSNAVAVLAVCSQVMVALGPALGGLLVGVLNWGGIFWINVPLAVIAAVVIVVWGPADPERGGASPSAGPTFDVPGMALFVLSVGSLMFWLLSLSTAPQWWWMALLIPSTAALVLWSSRAREPFLDLRLLRNRTLSATYMRTLCVYTAFYVIFYGLPSWLEQSRGLGATEAGLVVIPIAVLGTLSTIVAARLLPHDGNRAVSLVGTSALLVGGLLMTLPTRTSPVVALLGLSALLGLPTGFNNMANQSAVNAAAPAERAGAASGLYRTSQYVGANLAAAVLALLTGGRSDDAGLHHLGATVAVISAVLVAAALIGGFGARLRAARQSGGV